MVEHAPGRRSQVTARQRRSILGDGVKCHGRDSGGGSQGVTMMKQNHNVGVEEVNTEDRTMTGDAGKGTDCGGRDG